MKMDLNKYTANKKFIQNFYKKNKNLRDVEYCVSICAATINCPCIALAFYLGEDIGFTSEILDLIVRLSKSSGYDEFINAPESYREAIKNNI